jgi:hypothetical protein
MIERHFPYEGTYRSSVTPMKLQLGPTDARLGAMNTEIAERFASERTHFACGRRQGELSLRRQHRAGLGRRFPIIVREDCSVKPYAVDTSHVVWDFPAAGVAQVKGAIEHLARYLALVDGLLHVQFIRDGENVWLMELGRRCPGDLNPSLVELGTGLQHAARYASYFVAQRHILRHTLSAGHGNY